MRDEIKKLRRSLPERLTVTDYCRIKQCSRSSAYRDLRMIRGLGIKVGSRTFVVRDVMLAEMAKPGEPWVPLSERRQQTSDGNRPQPP